MKRCDICGEPARYDAKTSVGAWAFLCEQHRETHAVGEPFITELGRDDG